MSDRSDDYTDPESTEQGAQGAPAAPDTPWWRQSHDDAPVQGGHGEAPYGGAEAGAGQDASPPQVPYPPQATSPQATSPPPASPQDTPAQPTSPQPTSPQDPQGPYGYGQYGQGDPGGSYAQGGPSGWHGGQWYGSQPGWGAPGGGWGYQMPPAAKDGRPRRRGLAAVVATVLTAIALMIGIGIGYDVWSAGGTPTSGRTLSPGVTPGTSRSTFASTSSNTAGTKVSSSPGSPSNVATIRSKVTPALVDINTRLGYETEEAAGTGMVLTSTGEVLTNNHVIEGATQISVTDLGNGTVYSATVLGYTRTDDIAVLQLKGASHLKTVRIGNSSSVKVGEAIVGIGNAGGTGGVPSAAGGSVKALDRAITASDEGSLGTTYEHLTGLIESNADIQPGDSGGPLVTASGAVVGMDTAASTSEGYSIQGAVTGQGYSIPINEAMATARQIVAGKATATVHIGGTAFLGVYAGSVSTRTAFDRSGFGGTPTFTSRTGNVTPGSSTTPSIPTEGALVEQVIPGTPAERAGLAATDVITSVDGAPVTSPSDLTKLLLQHHPGDSVKVGWTTSSGQTATATITLASGPPE